MNYKKVKLSEICTIEKGATGITKAIEGQYPMVTMAEARSSHNEYQFDAKAVIIPLVSSSGHGHASMKRIHYQEGKFALGSILCAIIPKNDEEVSAKFLYNYLSFQKETLLVPLMRGAANVSLSVKSIASVEINLPPFERQIEINKLVDGFNEQQRKLQTELKTQATLLTKLRQAYLQEAVMGQLTAPTTDDAHALLADIKAQKAQLIKEGKLRKEKPLLPIKPEEIPFEIPKNWVWCRLGEIGLTTTGTTPSTVEKSFFGMEYAFIKPGDITTNGINYDNEGLSKSGIEEGRRIGQGSVLMVCIGGSIGKCFYVERECSCNQQINAITPFSEISYKYINIALQSDYFQALVWKVAGGGTTPIVNKTKWESILIPLPPLSEQQAIVAKVEGLLEKVSTLEAENKAQQAELERLMSAVLQEAFSTTVSQTVQKA